MAGKSLAESGEQLLSTSEVRRKAPIKRDRSRYVSWHLQGLPSRSGPRVYLEAVWVGRSMHTSLEAIARFLEACSR